MAYCITLRSKTDGRITGWYVGGHGRWSTDHKRQKLFDRPDGDAQIGGRARFVEMPHQHRVLARRGREFGSALAERVAKTKLALGISAPCGGSGKRPSPAGVEGPRFA